MIDEKFILFALDAANQTDVIKALVNRAHAEGRVSDAEEVVRAVLEREQEGTTGFGKGIAIPHGKSHGVTEPTLMYGRLKGKVDWKSMDDAPVDKIFLILVPETSFEEHLQILAKLARKLMHDDFVEGLNNVRDAKSMVTFLNEELES